MIFSLYALFACRPDCPPHALFEDGCFCEQDYYGELTWNKESGNWNGECISGLEKAIQTGDASYIKNETTVLDSVSTEMEQTIERNNSVLTNKR